MLKTKKEAKSKSRSKSAKSPREAARSKGFKVPGRMTRAVLKAAPKQALSGRLAESVSRFEAPFAVKDTISRLEARIPGHVYATIERAATLRGLTVTAYVTFTMGEDARRTIEQANNIQLDDLVRGITPGNRHSEIATGAAVGNEIL